MAEIFELEIKIKELNEQIKLLEHKRYRSQAALIEAILLGEEASDDDADYYNKYTLEINDLKNELTSCTSELNQLKKLQRKADSKNADEFQQIIQRIEEIEEERTPTMRNLVKCVLEGDGDPDPKDEQLFLRLTNEIKEYRAKLKAFKR